MRDDAVQRLIREAQKELFGFIPYEEYKGMFPTETRAKIYARLYRGTWTWEVHAKKSPGMGLWVNLKAVKALLDESAKQPRSLLRPED